MAVKSDLVSGTITLTNGSLAFTGTGTSFLLSDVRGGDEFLQIAGQTQWQAMVDTITSNTAGTLVRPWGGVTGTYAYRLRYQPDGTRSTAQARQLIELLGDGTLQSIAGLVGPGVIELLPGGGAQVVPKTDLMAGVKVDARVQTLAERAAFDGQPAEFSVYVNNIGDGRAAVYFKKSAASADWSTPAIQTGDRGDAGPFTDITFGPVTTVPNSTPASANVVEVDTDTIRIDLSIPKGQDGTGTGDVKGPSGGVVDDEVMLADGPTGKRLKGSGKTISELLAAPPSRREIVVNGRFLVNQRGVSSGTIPAGQAGYIADLWIVSNATNVALSWSVVSSQSFGRSREERCLTLVFAAAPSTGQVFIQYRIDGVNVIADTVATARLDVLTEGLLSAAPLSFFIIQNFGSGGSAPVTLSAVVPPETGVGPRRAVIAIPSTAGKTIGTGSLIDYRWSFTPRVSGSMTVTACSLVAGDARLDLAAPSGPAYSDELAACQFQFMRITGLPAGGRFAVGVGTGANFSMFVLPFQMRTVPAVTFSGMTVAASGATPAVTAMTALAMSAAGVTLSVSTASTAVDAFCLLRAGGTSDYIDLYAGLF